MKCSNCGSEIGNNIKCDYCGSTITSKMRSEMDTLNRMGCPKCGSTNIQFRRENQGEVRGKKSKKIIRNTVGFCKDCGNTWYPNGAPVQKKKTWLWILGWICIFPVPLTVLLMKKKDFKPTLKYGIIAASWLLYLVIGVYGGENGKVPQDATPKQNENITAVVTPTPTPSSTPKQNENVAVLATPTPTSTPKQNENVTVVATPTPTPTSTPIPEVTPKAEDSSVVDMELFKAIVEQTIGANFENHDIYVDDNDVLVINLWDDGIAEGVQYLNTGNRQIEESWDYLRSSMVNTCDTVYKTAQDLGLENPNIMLNVLNDLNTDNILLSTLNGTVIYDIANE